MGWFYTVVLCILVAGVIGALFSGISGDDGIFKCVNLLISLLMCVFIVHTIINKTSDGIFDSMDFDIEKNENYSYSDSVLQGFTNQLEDNIKSQINEKYAGAEAGVYVIAQINDSYEIEVFNVSVKVKEGDIYEIIRLIHNNYNIEKEKIYVQKE